MLCGRSVVELNEGRRIAEKQFKLNLAKKKEREIAILTLFRLFGVEEAVRFGVFNKSMLHYQEISIQRRIIQRVAKKIRAKSWLL
jgi:hypothetical protein